MPKANPEGAWIEHVWPGIQIHSGLAAGDLNADGLLDAVVDNIAFLSKNRQGTEWEQVTLPFPGRPSDGVVVEIADIDGDGDMDAAQMGHWTNGDVSWVENQDGSGKSWKKHVLGKVGDKSHSVNIVDLDHDGDLDIEMGADAGSSFWYENMGDRTFKAAAFTTRPTHDMRAGDIDRDGDLDLIGNPWGGGAHYYFQNTLVEKGGKKADWRRGPMGSHNPFTPNRPKKDGCMDPASPNYDFWAFHSGAPSAFCATTALWNGRTGARKPRSQQGEVVGSPNQGGSQSLWLRSVDGRLVSGPGNPVVRFHLGILLQSE